MLSQQEKGRGRWEREGKARDNTSLQMKQQMYTQELNTPSGKHWM